MREELPINAVLAADVLWKGYSGRDVVRGVSLCLSPGKVTSLLGPNGAGKSTIVGMMYGAVIPDSGVIRIGERNLAEWNRWGRTHLGVVTQDDNLDPDFNSEENLLHFAHHYGISGNAARRRVQEVLSLVDLVAHAQKSPDELSGGLRRRLVLARSLLNNPRFVFLDEPTTGLDPDARQEFWKAVRTLREEGKGILLTTHYMEEAERLSDEVILLQEGVVVDQGDPAALIEKLIGKEVVEVEGIDGEKFQTLAQRVGSWSYPYSLGFLASLPEQGAKELWEEIERLSPSRISRRRANLEDVFLRLTGKKLEGQ